MGLVALQHVKFSQTRDRTHVPMGRRILNHWTTRDLHNCFLLRTCEIYALSNLQLYNIINYSHHAICYIPEVIYFITESSFFFILCIYSGCNITWYKHRWHSKTFCQTCSSTASFEMVEGDLETPGLSISIHALNPKSLAVFIVLSGKDRNYINTC